MDVALRELASSGALGAIVAALFAILMLVVGVLLWALKKYVQSSIDDKKAALDEKKDFSEFMRALTASLNGLGLNFQATRTDTLGVVRDLGDRIEHVTWAAHDKMVLVFRDTLTGTANSIRTSTEALAGKMETERLRSELSRPISANPAPSGAVR